MDDDPHEGEDWLILKAEGDHYSVIEADRAMLEEKHAARKGATSH